VPLGGCAVRARTANVVFRRLEHPLASAGRLGFAVAAVRVGQRALEARRTLLKLAHHPLALAAVVVAAARPGRQRQRADHLVVGVRRAGGQVLALQPRRQGRPNRRTRCRAAAAGALAAAALRRELGRQGRACAWGRVMSR